jgi:hypothetical protein
MLCGGATMIPLAAILAAVGAGLGGLLYLAARRRRRRIVALDWPPRFQDWRTMRGYARRFFKASGWQLRGSYFPEAEFIVVKPAHVLAIQFLLEKDHVRNRQDHFLYALGTAAAARKLPILLVTDFRLDADVVARSGQHRVYPLFYKDLARLEQLVPANEGDHAALPTGIPEYVQPAALPMFEQGPPPG